MARTLPKRKPEQGPERETRRNGPAIAALVVSVAAAGYALAFVLSTPERRSAWGWLVIPDRLIAEWFGNDPARFGILDRLPIFLLTSIILCVAFLWGRLLLDALKADRVMTDLERCVFAAGMGLNLLSLTTLAFGLAGQLQTRWWFGGAAIAAVVLSAVRWRQWQNRPSPRENGDTKAATGEAGLTRLAIGGMVPFVLVILLGGAMPPWYFDVREYHLEIPKEWHQQGRIDFVPHNVYGNMPLGAEMHALLGMVLVGGPRGWWWGAMVGKTVIATFALLATLAILAFGRRYLSSAAGAVAAVVFLSTPWIVHVSTTGLIEGASALYTLLAVYATLLCTEHDSRCPGDRARTAGLAATAGFLVGAAVACKYPAVLLLAIPLFLWFAFVFLRRRQGWLPTAAFVIALAAGCGLWLGKNWYLSGNPTYPLLYDWFDGKTRTPEKDAQWRRAHSPQPDAEGHTHSAAQFRESVKLVLWSSSYAGPFLVPFAAWGLLSKRHRRLVVTIGAFCAYSFLTWWLFTHRIDRFLLPILPLAALLAGEGATWCSHARGPRIVFVLLLVCLVFQFLFGTSRVPVDNRFLVAMEDLYRDVPHKADLWFSRIHPAVHGINRLVGPGFRALAVGEAQVFDYEVQVLYNTCFDDCRFEQLMRGRTAEQRYAALCENRISHIFFSWSELDRYRTPGNYGYSNYVTRELVHRELLEEQKLLRRIPVPFTEESGEIFEVVGWQEWTPTATTSE